MNSQNTAEQRLGTVGTAEDGSTFVRFERQLPYPMEQVWSAITEPDGLAGWFPGFRLEQRKGGSFEIWFGGKCEGPAHVSGAVIGYDPPRLLQCGSMRWELSKRGSGCVLVFTDVLHFDGLRTRTEFANSVLGGWHNYMDMLEDALAGREVDPDRPELDYSKIQVPGRP